MNLEQFLTILLSNLSDQKIPYCILRNYKGLPQYNPGNDIDFLIRFCDKESVIKTLQGIGNILLTGYAERPYVVSTFVYGVEWGENKFSIQVDFFLSLSWKGLPYLYTEDVLLTARSAANSSHLIIIPKPSHEAIISFYSSYLVGGWIKQKYWELTRDVFLNNKNEVISSLTPLMNKRIVNILIDSVIEKDTTKIISLLRKLRKSLFINSLSKSPIFTINAIISHYYFEILFRFTPINIISACILGPDGAGKSEITKLLEKRLQNTVKQVAVRHLKPQLFKNTKSNGPVTDPHGKIARSAIISIAKIIFWFFELWVDRFFHGYKNLTLQIWDRYYHDILVDSKRYRYGGPVWVARLIGKLVPKPDLWILLDAPPEVLQARKKEVPYKETARQRDAYLRLISEMPSYAIVDASKPVDNVIVETERTILNFMAKRTAQRLNIKFDRLK